MQKYTYPAVVYIDEDGTYLIVIYDLSLVAQGVTMEEAYSHIQEFLQAFVDYAIVSGSEIPEPSNYEEIKTAYPKQQVLLVEYNK